MQLKVTSCT